jgi:hypothetical protein
MIPFDGNAHRSLGIFNIRKQSQKKREKRSYQ